MMGIMAGQVTPGPVKSKKRGLGYFDFHFQILVNIKRETMLIKNKEMRQKLLDAIATAGADLFFWDLNWEDQRLLESVHGSREAVKKALTPKVKEALQKEIK